MQLKEPIAVFDDIPIKNRYEKWYKEADPQKGDYLQVETSTKRGWKSLLQIVEESPEELTFKSIHGKKYLIVTYDSPNNLSAGQPTVRTADKFRSLGLVERIELYKL